MDLHQFKQKESVIEQLKIDGEKWSEAHASAERSGHMNSLTNRVEIARMDIVDFMLDRLLEIDPELRTNHAA